VVCVAMMSSIKSPRWYQQVELVLRALHNNKDNRASSVTDKSDIYITLPELLAFKNVVNAIDFKKMQLSRSLSAGDARSSLHGCGIEFDEVRPYQAGDDIRCIDWRVSARTGKPLTKLFREEREHSVYIAVDQRPTMFFGSQSVFKSVYAAQVAAIALWSAVHSGDRCGGVICADKLVTFRSARTRRSMLQLLEALSHHNNKLTANSQSALTLSNCIDNCQLHARAGATVLIISDFIDCDESAILKLQSLARRRSVILACISDPVENSLPMHGLTGISNGYQSGIASINKKFRDRYVDERNAWLKHLADCANKGGMLFVPLSTTDNVLALFGAANRFYANRVYRNRSNAADST